MSKKDEEKRSSDFRAYSEVRTKKHKVQFTFFFLFSSICNSWFSKELENKILATLYSKVSFVTLVNALTKINNEQYIFTEFTYL